MGNTELITVKEAADMLHCSEQQIRNLIKNGKISGIRPGKSKILVNKSDVEKIRNTPVIFNREINK